MRCLKKYLLADLAALKKSPTRFCGFVARLPSLAVGHALAVYGGYTLPYNDLR
jgi:hypothetical protein